MEVGEHPVLVGAEGFADREVGAGVALPVKQEVLTLPDCRVFLVILEDRLLVTISKSYLSVKRRKTRILDVHGDLFMLFRVCGTEELAICGAVDEQKTAAEGALSAPEQV